jgi:hypothetical protein
MVAGLDDRLGRRHHALHRHAERIGADGLHRGVRPHEILELIEQTHRN